MSKRVVLPAVFAAALLSLPACAATDDDLAQIREQIRQLKETYEARINALEARVKEAEARAAAVANAPPPTPPAAPAAEAPPPVAAAPSAASPASGIAAFNPAISVVLQGRYANFSQDPGTYTLSGFQTGGDASLGHRGFSLSESELAISANVDDKFAGNLIVSLAPDNSVSVEEAYGFMPSLGNGLVPRFGRFFSGIGYLNEQHQHVWDFVDAPLAYQAFLGGQFTQDGVQAKWVAPTDVFLEFGAELGSGDSFPGTSRNRNGANAKAAYVHAGGDIGDSNSWRAGVSYLHTSAGDRTAQQLDSMGNLADVAFTGKSDLAIADFVWKYAPNGNAQETNFKAQGEYIWRRESGALTYDSSGALGFTSADDYSARQSGWYLQGVYQFMPYWRVGARYDRLDPGRPDYGVNAAALDLGDFHPQRYSFMVDWTPSEFTRWRLQYADSRTRPGLTDHQIFIQYILTLGAHGAHRF